MSATSVNIRMDEYLKFELLDADRPRKGRQRRRHTLATLGGVRSCEWEPLPAEERPAYEQTLFYSLPQK